MPKLQVSTDRSGKEVFHVTVPKAIVKLKGWKKGTILEFKELNGNLCVVEMIEKK